MPLLCSLHVENSSSPSQRNYNSGENNQYLDLVKVKIVIVLTDIPLSKKPQLKNPKLSPTSPLMCFTHFLKIQKMENQDKSNKQPPLLQLLVFINAPFSPNHKPLPWMELKMKKMHQIIVPSKKPTNSLNLLRSNIPSLNH